MPGPAQILQYVLSPKVAPSVLILDYHIRHWLYQIYNRSRYLYTNLNADEYFDYFRQDRRGKLDCYEGFSIYQKLETY